jgi:hypothetical protein
MKTSVCEFADRQGCGSLPNKPVELTAKTLARFARSSLPALAIQRQEEV